MLPSQAASEDLQRRSQFVILPGGPFEAREALESRGAGMSENIVASLARRPDVFRLLVSPLCTTRKEHPSDNRAATAAASWFGSLAGAVAAPPLMA